MTDLLVGAVSVPLSIAVDALILRGTVSPSIFYFLSEIGVSFLITLYTISLYTLYTILLLRIFVTIVYILA